MDLSPVVPCKFRTKTFKSFNGMQDKDSQSMIALRHIMTHCMHLEIQAHSQQSGPPLWSCIPSFLARPLLLSASCPILLMPQGIPDLHQGAIPKIGDALPVCIAKMNLPLCLCRVNLSLHVSPSQTRRSVWSLPAFDQSLLGACSRHQQWWRTEPCLSLSCG